MLFFKIIWGIMKTKYNVTFSNSTARLGDLMPWEKNPRTLSERQYEKLKQSLERFGTVEPPVINTDGTIVAGHQRIQTLIKLYGADHTIDVRIPDRLLTEEELEEYNIVSNAVHGSFDMEMLANEFDMSKLDEWGFQDFKLPEELADFDDEGEVQTMRFKLHPNQALFIKAAIEQFLSKGGLEGVETFGNTHKKSNALYAMINRMTDDKTDV